tara:strand:+ start:223 stop:594 length:372 start_codon:yes stop_codon:yes gene_type:complete
MKEHVKINVKTDYISNRSNPMKSYYLFSYEIKIINNNIVPITLLSRHWNIKDSEGLIEDIFGPGVVGEKPTILPNQFYKYTSYCPLKTPVGFMEGEFRMLNNENIEFDVKIKPFRLSIPGVFN